MSDLETGIIVRKPNEAPQSRTERGFTLIEVMVAALLLLVVLIPMSAMLASAVRAAMVTENQHAASLLAQEQIEEMRSLNFDALLLNSAAIGAASGITGTNPYYFTYKSTNYQVAADAGGTIEPVSTGVTRRKAVFDIKRYVLLTAQPDVKKLVVKVSWTNPTPGELLFETESSRFGTNFKLPPSVVIAYPYIGEAFTDYREISNTSYNSEAAEVTAIATATDGLPVQADFQVKKNVDANFSPAATDSTATAISGGWSFSINWATMLNSEAQYSLRVRVTDDQGQTGLGTVPFFIDQTPPLAPASLSASALDGSTTAPLLWPLKLTWAPVSDYIDGNQNFNMVIGYLVYRDERVALDGSNPSSVLLAAVHDAGLTSFVDSNDMDPAKQYRYRIKSMGRARAWRTTKLHLVTSEAATDWLNVTLPTTAHTFDTFTGSVLAEATSWSAVRLTWDPQQDSGGDYADQYLIWRSPGFDGSTSYSLVASVADPGTGGPLVHEDKNLKRNTSYTYKVQPVLSSEYPTSPSVQGMSNSVTTDIY